MKKSIHAIQCNSSVIEQQQCFLQSNAIHSSLNALIDFMWNNVHRNISLDELAAFVHLSPSHFSRVFKEKMQLTPHQALLRIRVRKARSLIPKSHSLTEIAYRCGFSDQAHFTRVFKAQTGLTPSQYRKTNENLKKGAVLAKR